MKYVQSTNSTTSLIRSISGDGEDTLPRVYPTRTRPTSGGFVLSLDGGEYRGYASLLMLKNQLRRVQHAGLIYPYLYYDLICGTSTGGLIAILLGVLYLDIDTAINVYRKLGKTLFGSSWRTIRWWLRDAKFDTEPLKKAISAILQEHGLGRTLMNEPIFDRGCLCFVTTTHCDGRNNPGVVLVRSYPPPSGIDSIPHGHEWTIMDAALATAAAPTIFPPYLIQVDGYMFLFEDAGAHRANNPTLLAYEECGRIRVDDYRHFVSIGAGVKGPNRSKRDRATGKRRNIIKNMLTPHKRVIAQASAFLGYATDVTDVENEMRKIAKGYTVASYFRFNPPHLGDIDLADYTAIPAMEQIVREYCSDKGCAFAACAGLMNPIPASLEIAEEGPARSWWVSLWLALRSGIEIAWPVIII